MLPLSKIWGYDFSAQLSSFNNFFTGDEYAYPIELLRTMWTWIPKLDRYHPDKNAANPEASELFKEVAFSYSILSDPEKKRQYDSSGFEVCFFLLFLHYILLPGK